MHRVAARVLVGKELCRDEVFLEVSWDFIQSIFITGLVIVKLPLGPLRGLMAWPLSLLHRWKLNRAYKMLLPVVKRRIQERRGILDSERPLDAIEWTLSLSDQYPRDNNPEKITVELLQNLWAGSASPGGLVTEMLYNVLTEPKYLYPLRQEAENALAAHGWSEKFLDSLGLQDSFIKETNRLHSTGSGTYSKSLCE
ncbi:hypothetical protein MMC10_001901 [Thelotrema lepadinum]|nr:hypothetical protein [Thelotrema lepadinum]